MSPPGELTIYTVELPPVLDGTGSSERHLALRMQLAEGAVEAVSGEEAGQHHRALVVLPAGFLRTRSDRRRDQAAAELLRLSTRCRVALAFGVDVLAELSWAPLAGLSESYGYLCDRGTPLLWPGRRARAGRGVPVRTVVPREDRCLTLDGTKLAVLLSSEVFSASFRATLDRAGPDLALVLAHAGVTDRWQAALRALERVAPTVVVGGSGRGSQPMLSPRGWRYQELARTPELRLGRYLRTAPTAERESPPPRSAAGGQS